MKITLGRYRLRIGLTDRRQPPPDRASGDVPDHELAMLRDAEREYHERTWADRSLLSSDRW